MKKQNAMFAVLAMSSISVFAAGDINAGKAKSASCAACHGAAGISPSPEWPNLANQKAAYLVNQLKAFKDGSRKSPLMAPMAMSLTEQDMQNLAAYYASLK